MKKLLTIMILALALATGASAAAQKHRHHAQQELTDSAKGQGAVEVYSDTTSAVHSAAAGGKWALDDDDDNWPMDDDDAVSSRMMTWTMDRVMDNIDADGLMGMLFVLGVLFIIFVLAPVLIIIALFYFINKNRKQRLKLAQMAMQQGQPIPDQLLEDKVNNVTDEYQKGMRQCFVGVGLMIFLGYAVGNVGFGVGALVFCIGLGKVFAAKTTKNNS